MKIKSINIFRYNIPFINAQYGKGQDSAYGALISIEIEGSDPGWGEISFIESRKLQKFENLVWQIEEYKLASINEELTFDEVISLVPIHVESANVRFALELAIYDCYSKSLHRPLSKIIKDDAGQSVSTNGLYGAGIDVSSFDIIKVKTMSNNTLTESRRIRSIASEFPGSMIRIDGNQIFDLPRAIRFIKELDGLHIDYIEQLLPKDDSDDISELKLHTDIPLAVDESASSIGEIESMIYNDAADVFVIKPSQFGGVTELIEAAKLVKNNNLRLVITHGFETAVGRMGNIHMALSLTDECCGFAMGRYLEKDLCSDGIASDKIITVDDSIGHGISPTSNQIRAISE